MISRILLFLLINFGALAIGGLFTGKGVSSEWYVELDKAPWTPPGWVFGAAWTSIMLAFSLYMAYLWPSVENKKLLLGLFVLQWILNVSWNPIFFYFQQTGAAMIAITALTFLVGYFLFSYWSQISWKSLLLLPYFVWLIIASSLNAYILWKN